MIIRDLVITGLCKLLRNVTVQNLVTEAINEVTKDEISNLSGLTDNVQLQIQRTNASITEAQMEQNNWKSQISDAINNIPRNPGGELASTASLDRFLHEIGEIEHGPDVSGVTATTNDVMADRKYVNANWELKNGAMIRRGTPTPYISISPTSDDTNTLIRIPKGGYMEGNENYCEISVPNSGLHSHMGLTAEKILMDQSINYIQGTATNDANAQAGHILKDKTAYIKGVKVTGSMTNYSGQAVNYAGYETVKIGLEPKDSSQVQISFENKGKLTGYFDGNTVFKGNIYLPMDKVAYGTKIGRYKDFQTSNDTFLTGSYTGDATANNNYIVEGVTAYAKGNKLTGIIPNRGKKGSRGKYGMVSLTRAGEWSDINVSKSSQLWTGYHISTNSDNVRRFCIQVPAGVYGGEPTDVSQAYHDAIGGDGYVGIEMSKFGNANISNVLEGKTFTSMACADGTTIGISGEMCDFSRPENCDYRSNAKGWGLMRTDSIMETSDKDLGNLTAVNKTWLALFTPRAGFYNSTAIGAPLQDIMNIFGLTSIKVFSLTNGKEKSSGNLLKKRIISYTNPEFVQLIKNEHRNFILLNHNSILDIEQNIADNIPCGNIGQYQAIITDSNLGVSPVILFCYNDGGRPDIYDYSTNMATKPSKTAIHLAGLNVDDNTIIGNVSIGSTTPNIRCEVVLSENTLNIIIQPGNNISNITRVGIPGDTTFAFIL